MLHSKKIIQLPVFLFTLLVLTGCSTQPLLSELVNSRLTLILKGTYESNGTVTPQTTLLPNKYTTPAGAANSNADSEAFKIYMDIAEIRLARGDGPGKDPSEYWQNFARERVVLCPDTDSLDGRPLSYCQSNDGVAKHAAFFNGSGIAVDSAVDVKAQEYNHLAIYFRRFVSSPSFTYNSAGAKTADNKASFDGQTIWGDHAGVNYFFAPSDGGDTIPRLIPLENKNLSLEIPSNDQPFVLEVRILLNGVLMKHLTKLSDGNYVSFIGPSNWSGNVYDASGKLGGNFTLIARTYQPGNVGSIKGTGFIAAVKAGAAFSGYALPLAASRTGVITNLAAGSYDVYKPVEDAATGFPKAPAAKCATVTVTAGQEVNASGC